MEALATINEMKTCPLQYVLAINDTLNVISGKWKLPIIASLMFEKRRFNEIQRNVNGISPRMLSKELKELEMNGVLKRNVYNTVPVTVEYELTPSARQLNEVLDKMVEWGYHHRKSVLGKI